MKTNKQIKEIMVHITDRKPRLRLNRPYPLYSIWQDGKLQVFNDYEHVTSTHVFDISFGTVSIDANGNRIAVSKG